MVFEIGAGAALDLQPDLGCIEWNGEDLNFAGLTSAMQPAMPPVIIITPRGMLFGEYFSFRFIDEYLNNLRHERFST
jgi:hypothetical protein